MANDADQEAPSRRHHAHFEVTNAARPMGSGILPSEMSTSMPPTVKELGDYDDDASRFFTPSRTSGISSSPNARASAKGSKPFNKSAEMPMS